MKVQIQGDAKLVYKPLAVLLEEHTKPAIVQEQDCDIYIAAGLDSNHSQVLVPLQSDDEEAYVLCNEYRMFRLCHEAELTVKLRHISQACTCFGQG